MIFNDQQLKDLLLTAQLSEFEGSFLKHLESELILFTLKRYHRNQRAVSRLFKLPKSTLSDKLKSRDLILKQVNGNV